MKTKILLFGPLPPLYTGQSAMFVPVVASFDPGEIIVVNITRFSSAILNTLYTIFYTIYIFLFYTFETVYFTSSRSRMGFIKDIPLLLFGKWFRKRIVNHLHGINFLSFYEHSNLMKPFITYCYRNVDTSIVLVDQMKREFKDFPQMNISVIGNCYDELFDSLDETRFQKRNHVLFLSGLMKSKGILDFLEACEIILQAHPKLIIRIAGQFHKDDFMSKKEISSSFFEMYNGLKRTYLNRIEYLGLVKDQEKVDLFYTSDIFVLPTWHPSEGYPVSILEAMRAGNAIVTTHHNFLSTIVSTENGVLVEPHSRQEIANAVISLLSDPDRLKNIQQNNRTFARKNCNPEKYINAIRSILLDDATFVHSQNENIFQ